MLRRYAPATVRAVPEQFGGIYVHGVGLSAPERLLFLSGQIGITPEGATLGTFAAQCHQAIDNVEALLAEAEMTPADILRVTYFLTDARDLADLTRIRQARWASAQPPAVTTLVVAALASPDLLVEIEVTAGV